MRTLLLLIAICFTPLISFAQQREGLAGESMKGTFYVSVDDYATIYVNGKEVYRVRVAGDSRSGEIELKVGDRIVVQLIDAGGGHRFMMVFGTTDGQKIVSFRNQDFRIVPELELTDFTPEQLSRWTKFAKKERNKDRLPIKSSSEWIWGELNKTILAGVVTPSMVSQKTR